jgi:hypothetical protein
MFTGGSQTPIIKADCKSSKNLFCLHTFKQLADIIVLPVKDFSL